MLQIVENILKEGRELEYISIAKKFTRDLSQLGSVNFSKVYRNDEKVYIVTDWSNYDADAEMELFLKYKAEMKPLFVSNAAMRLIEIK
ncbi:hypothetical protein [Streptococcus anginosus]|uniref:ABM domain-containing protein n=1 Tax=Streptococcus anginosus TaxID=1328 RepID=A0A448AG93_STRAP|nr:hypothetical protein [Streptococcus anginosus]GAD39837.1 hypothetical protein ANG3_0300 [Streptococcus intermedius SK54 = ATCC 27335]EGL46999.1 hypothetical protein HMPREF9966_1008 [Streptococcus anginosus SK52 = DSM 20563]MBZ2157292.1 hypothetical protein [Streptococcus anginosus]ORE83810.1 hypothetical protein B6C93_04205 [Streptococcus anginosus SK52 = DSM 20563]UEB02319.1 hypothetical protein LK450_01345 [Streptococcus anginosus subsp. anginosus]